MPAYKDGVDLSVYLTGDKRLDERGIDLKNSGKFVRDKGVGVVRDEWVQRVQRVKKASGSA
jgi:hypothetical protein